MDSKVMMIDRDVYLKYGVKFTGRSQIRRDDELNLTQRRRSSNATMNRDRIEAATEFVHSGDEGSKQRKLLYGGFTRLSQSYSDLKKKLDTMLMTVERMEKRMFGNDDRGKNIAESYRDHDQVPISIWEQNRKENQLGYRSGVLNVENRDNRLTKVEMPVFDVGNTYKWLKSIESFFDNKSDDAKLDLVCLSLQGEAMKWFCHEMKIMKFRDWADFKHKLLSRFAYKSLSMQCSSPEMIQKEKVTKKKVETKILASTNALEKTDSMLEHELTESLVFEDNLDASCERTQVVQNTDFGDKEKEVQDTTLSHVETIGVLQAHQTQSSLIEPCYFTNLVSSEEKDIMAIQRIYLVENAENAKISRSWTGVLQPDGVHQLVTQKIKRVTSKKKQRKFFKTWKFKFKNRSMHGIDPQELRARKDIKYISFCFKTRLGSTLKGSKFEYGEIMRPPESWLLCNKKKRDVLRRLMQNILVVAKFQVKHKWRFKKFSRVSDIINKRELQTHGSYRGSYHIIFAISSLWASLFSWGKVCKIKLTRKRTRTWWLPARFQYLSKSVMMSQVKNEVRFKHLKSVSDLAIVDRWSLTRMDKYLAWGQVVACEGGKLCPRKRRICMVYGSIGCFFILQLMGMRDKVQHVLTYNGYLKFKTIKRESGSIGEKLWVKPMVGYCMKHGSKKSGSQVWHRWKIKTAKLHNVLTFVLVKLQGQRLSRMIRDLVAREESSGLCPSSSYTFNKYYCGKRYTIVTWRILGMKLFLFTTSSFFSIKLEGKLVLMGGVLISINKY